MEEEIDPAFLDPHRKDTISQHLNRISGLEISLARAWSKARKLPGRHDVVNEWIVEGLRNLVRDGGDVGNSTGENSWQAPSSKREYPARLRTGIVVGIRMKSAHAAIANPSLRIE